MPRRSTNGTVIVISVVYAALAVAAGAMLALGLVRDQQVWTIGGLFGVILVAVNAPVAILMGVIVRRIRATGLVNRTLTQIQEHSMLSDNAKRVLFRDREVLMLRNAIEDDIARGDHDAAITLCNEMANLFGYREEAEAFRSRIVQARQQQYELEVQAAVDQLDAALTGHDWASVHQQAARIRRLFPESHLVGDLDRRIQHARGEHKQALEARFLEAADQDDPRAAMALLRQLDRYLTRDEAERLTEVAQGVVTRYRGSLGAEFRRAVGEHRWADAAQVGETIIADYPNTQMANEVRSMLEVLRSKAGQAAVAGEIAQR